MIIKKEIRFFFFQAEDGIRDGHVTGVQTCALPISLPSTLNRMHEVIPGARVEGKAVMDGQDLYAPDIDPVEVRRQIGMVFQRPNPFPTMSIADNVLAGVKLNNRRIAKARSEEHTSELQSRGHLVC